MDTRIKTKDYTLTPEAQAHLDDRIAAIEKSLSDDAVEVRLEVEIGRAQNSKHGDVWSTEMNLFLEGKALRADVTAETVNAAIDEAKNEIVRQYRKQKQFHRRMIRRGGAMLKGLTRFGRDS